MVVVFVIGKRRLKQATHKCKLLLYVLFAVGVTFGVVTLGKSSIWGIWWKVA